MATTVTVKGQVTIPKKVREAAGIRPGDRVEVRVRPGGGVIIEKPGSSDDYKARVHALAKRQLIRGITSDELMKLTRGDPGTDPEPGSK
jgi:antitoxin PrlF